MSKHKKPLSGEFFDCREFGGLVGYRKIKLTKVIYNDPATIAFFSDGTKTVCKVHDGDTYNAETGLALCILKRLSKPEAIYELFQDWLPEEGNTVTAKDVRRKHKND